MQFYGKQNGTPPGDHSQPGGPCNRKDNMKDKTITIAEAVERMITAVNIVTGDDGSRSKRAVVTFIELLKMNKKDYAKQQKFYG